jgi:outer membrane protein
VAEAQMKIGFVNTERVFREAAPAKRAQQALEREFSVRNAELGRIEKQGRDLQTELEKENVTIPDGARREKERQLADISRNFQRMQREIREDLNLRRNEELAKVQERATRVINQIAEQEKFDLILQEAVFASGRIDITDKVIRALADR